MSCKEEAAAYRAASTDFDQKVVARDQKRAALDAAAAEYEDAQSEVTVAGEVLSERHDAYVNCVVGS